ncbi:MAG: hypothetical protein A3E82_04485 [Gammaproteobacteria bacterium RIFCSPHIGHO2_12_FULL_38_11]|nr:MAG: hypothetical protein A3E82_04485 [Gammaproteobacteria bacterium RIFCSPHIGHO2_12_FULL_38_11]
MKKLIMTIALVSSVSLLSGCASIVDGTSQKVAVQTPPVNGAQCVLENNKGKWIVNGTPGSVTVHRSEQAMAVTCQKRGYLKDVKTFESRTKPMLAGNIIFGGLIGGAIDAGDGAAYRYPALMQVPLKRN